MAFLMINRNDEVGEHTWPGRSAGRALVPGLPSRKPMRMLVDGAMWTPWKPRGMVSERSAMIFSCDNVRSHKKCSVSTCILIARENVWNQPLTADRGRFA